MSGADDATRAFFERLLEHGIKPHAEDVAAIVLDGGIAVVAFEPGVEALAFLEAMGWKGRPVFRLPIETKRALERTDDVTRGWCRRKGGPARLFVVAHEGTLLLNHDHNGFYLEERSSDRRSLS